MPYWHVRLPDGSSARGKGFVVNCGFRTQYLSSALFFFHSLPSNPSIRRAIIAVQLVFLLFPALFLAAGVLAFRHSYADALGVLKPHTFFLPTEPNDYQVVYFSPARYATLPVACLFLAGVGLVAALALWRRAGSVAARGVTVWRQTRAILRAVPAHLGALSAGQKWTLGAVLLAIATYRIGLAFRVPPYPDEMWSYLSFVSQGWLITLTYYPDTNNHVLFNLLCVPLAAVFDSPAWIMRVPPFLTGMLLLVILFTFLSARVGYGAGLLAMLLSGFVPETSFFSVVGRGHTLAALCAVVSAFCLFSYLYGSGKRLAYLFWFSLAGIAGLFTVPTFTYHLFSLACFAVLAGALRQRRTVRDFCVAGLVIAGFTLLLYSPILLVSGPTALFAHRWVKPHDFGFFLRIFPVIGVEQLEYLFSILLVLKRGYLYVLVVLALLLFTLRRCNLPVWARACIGLSLLGIVCPFVLYLPMRVAAPYRVFVYLMYFLHMSVAIMVVHAARHWLPFLSPQPAPPKPIRN